jgi:hypothetical protein
VSIIKESLCSAARLSANSRGQAINIMTSRDPGVHDFLFFFFFFWLIRFVILKNAKQSGLSIPAVVTTTDQSHDSLTVDCVHVFRVVQARDISS